MNPTIAALSLEPSRIATLDEEDGGLILRRICAWIAHVEPDDEDEDATLNGHWATLTPLAVDPLTGDPTNVPADETHIILWESEERTVEDAHRTLVGWALRTLAHDLTRAGYPTTSEPEAILEATWPSDLVPQVREQVERLFALAARAAEEDYRTEDPGRGARPAPSGRVGESHRSQSSS